MPVGDPGGDTVERNVNRSARDADHNRQQEHHQEDSRSCPRPHREWTRILWRRDRETDYFSFQDSPPSVSFTPERKVNGSAG